MTTTRTPARLIFCLALACLAFLALPSCNRADAGPPTRQGSPEEVIETAQSLVRAGQAERLHELLLADDPRMRELFRRLGVLLGSLQSCSQTFAERYPAEIERLRAEAANSPGLASLLNRRGNRGNRGGGNREAFSAVLERLLADPYGALDDGANRITTVAIDDRTHAILFDNMPVLPPLGMVMTERDGRWFVVPPLNIPFLTRFLPQTDDEFKIIAYLFQVLDNAVREIEAEVTAGTLTDADDLSRAAGEKVFIPASMVFLAYSRAMEARDNNAGDD